MFRFSLFFATLTIFGLFFSVSGCSTANSRVTNNRFSQLESRVQKLESGATHSGKSVPEYTNVSDLETVSVDQLSLPPRKMPGR